ncbi:MAG: hypothetical protein ACJAQU_000326 [Loktanella salsilacus]|jgi:hypothetical protein
MHKVIATVFAVALLSNCAPAVDYSGPIANAVPVSASIKSQIVRDARDLLLDPYSIRDAEISGVATFADGSQGVCVKANARNAMGGYSGRQSMAINIRNGVLVGHTDDSPLCARPDVTYQPFPELEALANL